jgi:hypothetical protein
VEAIGEGGAGTHTGNLPVGSDGASPQLVGYRP